jgi:hypothetical protein
MFNLSQLINTLRVMPDYPIAFKLRDDYKLAAFEGTDQLQAPGSFDSYRGNYAQLALGSVESNTTHRFLGECISIVGKTFDGWTGGEFTMHATTDIYIAEPGHTSDLVIVGVMVDKKTVYLIVDCLENYNA